MAELRLYLFDIFSLSKKKEKKKEVKNTPTEALRVEDGGSNPVSDFSSFNCLHKFGLICQLKLHYDDWHRRGWES